MTMQLIAHRGYWLEPAEKNTSVAFVRALQNGFGIETDFRDFNAGLVVSHDVPTASAMTASEFARLFRATPVNAPMALNIKADGLQKLLADFAVECPMPDAFVFDMSVPDMRGYLTGNIPVYTRLSEFEPQPAFFEQSAGVWLDAFEGEWYGMPVIQGLLDQGKKVAIVSPELHRRPHLALWTQLRDNGLHLHRTLSLCTDFPLDARTFFHA
jgi:hypothetical protein